MNKTFEKIGKTIYENRIIFSIILIVFSLGFIIGTASSVIKKADTTTEYYLNEDKPATNTNLVQEAVQETIQLNYASPEEKPSPQDRIPENQIEVYNDRVIINIADPEWATFTDTNSMDPIIDKGANAIEIIPKDASEIDTGDIISYESEYATGTIIHRVTQIGQDEEGWYCKTKGDNIVNEDPGKIRFSQIRRVVVAIIY